MFSFIVLIVPGSNSSCFMRLLSISIVLVLLKYNYGQEESTVKEDDLISDVFKPHGPECGVRNKKDAIFHVVEHHNESQFGEFIMGSSAFMKTAIGKLFSQHSNLYHSIKLTKHRMLISLRLFVSSRFYNIS